MKPRSSPNPLQVLARRLPGWWAPKGGGGGARPDQYTCGTLHYTPAALAVLFGWLLWGDLTMLIPWTPQIVEALLKTGAGRAFLEMFPCAPLVLGYGILIALFQIFHMFIGTVYYYLIPDTCLAVRGTACAFRDSTTLHETDQPQSLQRRLQHLLL